MRIDADAGLPLPGPRQHAATRRRVGVLTFHRSFNYGSYWQARCLVEGLRGMGHDAELLDHSSIAVERAEARCLMQPSLPERTARADFPRYKAKARKFIAATRELPLSRSFPLHAPETSADYDAIVVGSDEVWNFRHPWYGGQPIFFGEGLSAPRLVSYAASFGNHDASEAMHPHWAARLGGFSAISVRDANSRRLVEGAVGQAPALVLDPCLQFPAAAERPRDAAPGARYAIVYGHGFAGWVPDAVARWARTAGVRLVSIGYRNDWADEQRLDAGPHDFAALMAGAEAVVTNFFHGCVFALLNDRPLVAAPTPYRRNKVRDLVAALGIEERLLVEAPGEETLAALLATPPGSAVAARIAALRRGSGDFLAAALG